MENCLSIDVEGFIESNIESFPIAQKYRNIAKATHCFLIAQQLGKHLSFPPAGPGARNVLAMLYDGDVVVGTEVGYCVVPETESLDLSLT